MKERKSYPFCKMYKGLMMAFTPPESVFMIYMADIAALQNIGHRIIRSKKKHMAYTNIGYRAFDHCVEKTVSMGLLERIQVDGMYEYVWDLRAFNRLLDIVNSTNSYASLKAFCYKAFNEDKRRMQSISNAEIEQLALSRL